MWNAKGHAGLDYYQTDGLHISTMTFHCRETERGKGEHKFKLQKSDTLVTYFILKASSSVLIVPNIIFIEVKTLPDHASLSSFTDTEKDNFHIK